MRSFSFVAFFTLSLLAAESPKFALAEVADPDEASTGNDGNPKAEGQGHVHLEVIRSLQDSDGLEPIATGGSAWLGTCQGDCDRNGDCFGDLICYQRDKGDPIPCCDGIGTGGRTDFCALPNCGTGGSTKLGTCQGDCNDDDDCFGDLRCYQRNAGDPIPCCDGISTSFNTDYCAPADCGAKPILGTCQGDCNDNDDCFGDLVCIQRNAGDPVPCCEGIFPDANDASDFCAPANCQRADPLGTCQGDCNDDDDCFGDLKCYQRNAGDPIPCCQGIFLSPTDSSDFCAPSSCVTPQPVTPPPTDPPVDPPTDPPVNPPTDPPVNPPTDPPVNPPTRKPTIDADVDVTVCFSESVMVQVLGKGPIPMKDLQVGDPILTAENKYETVYAFGHYLPEHKTTFLKIETSSSNANYLEVTGDHLIYKHGMTNPVRASSIQVGDHLEAALQQQQQQQHAVVTKISTVTRTGIYAPLTTGSGTFLANGFKVSSYAALQLHSDHNTSEYGQFQDGTPFMAQHAGVHLVVTPFRMYCRFLPSACPAELYNSNTAWGMPNYVANGIDFLKWADQLPMWLQVCLFVPALFVFGALRVLEYILLGDGYYGSSGVVSLMMRAIIVIGLSFVMTIFYQFQCHPGTNNGPLFGTKGKVGMKKTL